MRLTRSPHRASRCARSTSFGPLRFRSRSRFVLLNWRICVSQENSGQAAGLCGAGSGRTLRSADESRADREADERHAPDEGRTCREEGRPLNRARRLRITSCNRYRFQEDKMNRALKLAAQAAVVVAL